MPEADFGRSTRWLTALTVHNERCGLSREDIIEALGKEELVLGKLAGRMLYEKITGEYELTKEQILSALKYAVLVLSEEEIRMVPYVL